MKFLSDYSKSEKLIFSGKMYLIASVCFLLVCILDNGARSIAQPYFSLGCAFLCIGLALLKKGRTPESENKGKHS